MNTVWIASYSHKYGEDLCAFSTEEKAWAWADQIAREWWGAEFVDEDLPEVEPGKAYFERMADLGEFFTVQESAIDPI